MEAKGWFADARLTHAGRNYALTFYDPVRLHQEIEDELQRAGLFYEPNLIVVPSVTRAHMEHALGRVVQSGLVASFTPKP